MVAALDAELLYLYRYLRQRYIIIPLGTANNVTKKSADFPFLITYRCKFVAVLEDAELLCNVFSDPVQVRLSCLKRRCKYNDGICSGT